MPKNNKKRGQRGPEEDEEVEKVLQDLANGEDSGTALGGGQQQKGGKGGKKNRRNQAADEDEEVERILQAIANGEEVPEDSQPATNKKGGAKQQQQKKGRRGQRGPGEDDEEDGEDEPAPAKQQQQQKGGNKKGANKRNNRRGDDDDENEEEPAPAPAKQQQQQQKGGKGKNNRRNRGAEDDEEVEKVLQDLAEGKEPASSPAPQPKQQQQKGGKKNRRNQAADEDEEVEAILQAIAEGKEVPDTAAPKGGKKGQQQQKQQQKAAAEEEEEEEADGGDDDAEGEGEGTKQLSAAAKKRLKKKQKEQEKKAQAAAGAAAPKGGKAGAAAGAKGKAGAAGKAAEAAPAAGGAAKKPRSAIAAMILKQQEEERKRKEEEERLIREEEERLRKELEEQERQRKELEEKRAANRLKKKEKNKDAEKRRAERERQEKLARLGIAAPAGEDGAPKQKKPQSALYAKPKKQRPVVKTQEEQEAEAQKQQEQAAAAAAAEAAAAAAKTEEPESWEEADEWEQKAEEPAGAAAEEPAAAAAEEEKKEEEPKAAEEPVASPTEAEAKGKGKTAGEGDEGGEKKPTLRSPICCILGHVDTGKTKLLDKIRQTNVQGGEAGGITQQIGASFFPLKALKEKTKAMAQKTKFQIKVPGLLVIDTPGHESFTNLRSRGSSLCDIAVLVVDLMHGLEPQTLESIKLLRQRKTPFIVALNKIDRIYGWKETPNAAFQETLKKQNNAAKQEFETRVAHTVTMFAEQGLNAVLYYQNKDFVHNVSLVPTSAHTGEGIPDMLALLIQLTQTKLTKRIVTKDLFQATVLEVKVVEGLGTTIDVILVNGVLHEGDRIVVCGLDGPIATNIRALLTPHPMRELRVKTPYQHHKQVVAAQGVKISAQGLDRAVAGSSLVVVGEKDDEELIMSRVQADLTDILKKVQKRGVCVQASTLGSLEALLTFLGESNIPVGSINIGPVHKADVIKASVNLDKGKRKEFGCILAFDVPVDKDAKTEAAKAGVRIFTADIIYHLFDQFTAYLEELKAKEKAEAALKVVFPCILEIVPGCVFNKKDPIVIGVRVVEGLLKLGTPLCVQKVVTTTDDEGRTRNRKEMLYIGKITSLQDNHKEVPQAVVDQQVAVKIEGGSVTFGRQLDESSKIYSQLSRESIDALKDHFRDVLVANKGMVALIQKLKPMFDIM